MILLRQSLGLNKTPTEGETLGLDPVVPCLKMSLYLKTAWRNLPESKEFHVAPLTPGQVVVYRASTPQVWVLLTGWARSTLPFIPAAVGQ
ncbi:hypothetical protein TNCV_1899811 [Trichonephila clavipes]|nr:hypothetical protein TNCV_1899811 [Trichonephila clavipes]